MNSIPQPIPPGARFGQRVFPPAPAPVQEPATPPSSGPTFSFSSESLNSSGVKGVPTVNIPAIDGAPYVQVTTLTGDQVLCVEGQTVMVIGRGPVLLSEILGAPMPSPPSARGIAPSAGLQGDVPLGEKAVLDTPLPDSIDQMIESAVQGGVDALAGAAKSVTPDQVDDMIDGAVDAVDEIVREQGEKMGFLKRRLASEQKVNGKIGDFEETIRNHPVIKQGLDTFRTVGSASTNAAKASVPKNGVVVCNVQ